MKMQSKKIRLYTYFVMGIALLASCTQDNSELYDQSLYQINKGNKNNPLVAMAPVLCGSASYTLSTAQNLNAGTVLVGNDADNLYVNYKTSYAFGVLHLWAGTDVSLIPIDNQGTPIANQFPFNVNVTGLYEYNYVIPLTSLSYYTTCGSTIFVVAQAELTINGNSVVAYAGNLSGTGSTPWKYAAYLSVCCDGSGGTGGTGTQTPTEKLGSAFAKGNYVFASDDKCNPDNLRSLRLTKNRWGWSINIKSEGTYTYDLWAGAGLNNTEGKEYNHKDKKHDDEDSWHGKGYTYTPKGKLVGSVTIIYDGSHATVNYVLNNGFLMEEAHIYARDNKPYTIAPGQYGNNYYFTTYTSTLSQTFDLTDTNNDGVWFICHAVVWGAGITNQ
jgi:hypothetical protein